MQPFKQRTIVDLETNHNVDGITAVKIFRLHMSRQIHSRHKQEKEVLVKGFSGAPTRSVSELVGDGESVVPEQFVVNRAYFYFRFAHYDALSVPLAPDSASLQLDNDAYKLVEQYFAEMGFDIIHNRRQRRHELQTHS